MSESAETVRLHPLPQSATTPTALHRARYQSNSDNRSSGKRSTSSITGSEGDMGIERLVPEESGTPFGGSATVRLCGKGVEIEEKGVDILHVAELSRTSGDEEAEQDYDCEDNESDATEVAASDSEAEVVEVPDSEVKRTSPSPPLRRPSLFCKGNVVEVMPRLWPGMNKQGGTARITAVHYVPDEDVYRYDVAYIVDMGSKERRVEEKFIKLNKDLTTLIVSKPVGAVSEDHNATDATAAVVAAAAHQRNTQGRCKICSSFIGDCQHEQPDEPRRRQKKKNSFDGSRSEKQQLQQKKKKQKIQRSQQPERPAPRIKIVLDTKKNLRNGTEVTTCDVTDTKSGNSGRKAHPIAVSTKGIATPFTGIGDQRDKTPATAVASWVPPSGTVPKLHVTAVNTQQISAVEGFEGTAVGSTSDNGIKKKTASQKLGLRPNHSYQRDAYGVLAPPSAIPKSKFDRKFNLELLQRVGESQKRSSAGPVTTMSTRGSSSSAKMDDGSSDYAEVLGCKFFKHKKIPSFSETSH